MAYMASATVAGESLMADLEMIGFSAATDNAPGRIVTHQLANGDYLVRGQGYAPMTMTLSGEFDPNPEEGDDPLPVLENLQKMRGHEVTLQQETDTKMGHLRSVTATYHDWRHDRYIRVSWRADLVLNQVGTLDVG